MTRVLVCGGRDYADEAFLRERLNVEHARHKFTLLIHGNAKGADKFAVRWARDNGVPRQAVPADWLTYGKAAGPIRNQAMIDDYMPGLVIAFPGGRGTADMVRRAFGAGVTVIEVTP